MTVAVAEVTAGGWRGWMQARRGRLRLALTVLLTGLGFAGLHLVLRDIHPVEVRAAIAATPGWRIAAALALTAASYLTLTGYDVIGLGYVGKPQPWRVAAVASFTSFSVSNNFGLAMLTGSSVRYRAYSPLGLSLGDVARIGLLAAVAFWVGVAVVGALAVLAAPGPVAIGSIVLPVDTTRMVAVGIAIVLAVVPLLRMRFGGAIRIGGVAVMLPDARRLVALGIVATVDVALAAATLAVLVPGLGMADVPTLILAYAVALAAGVVAHTPGGLGVFEAVVLAAVPHDRSPLFAALLLYRLIYYLLPLLVAGAMVAILDGGRLRRPLATGLSLLDRAARALSPMFVTLLVFAGGVVLLLSGALPSAGGRLDDLQNLPLPLIEGSHLAGSLAGVALLLVAPALAARLTSGFHAARLLLVGGAIFSLLKGLDYEEASVLLVMAALLQYSRPAFYRQGGILSEPVDRAWIAAGIGALALSIWAGFFAYKHTPYSNDLWWRFALDGDAPRFLRASFGAGVVMAAAVTWRLLLHRHRPGEPQPFPAEVWARALPFATRSDAALALTGDKRFVLSAASDAFLMYAVQGRTWVVMGDPVGPRARWSELAWAIRRECDAVRGRLCFFQASETMLPLFVDLGLRVFKYGEEARIPLPSFTLEGPKAKALRYGRRRALAVGLSFAVVPRAEVGALLPALRAVSDAWLDIRGTREKRFSLGMFEEEYLSRFDCAVVREGGVRDGGRIVAFANIWSSGDGQELSVDLMRHVADAPYGAMDFLFVELLDWGRAAGFACFNLGMAPLAGINGDRLAPVWAKLARTLFENGERFYSFAGLRAFKSKFDPVWTSRYIAASSGGAVVPAMIDLVAITRGE